MAYAKLGIPDLPGEVWKEITWIEGLVRPAYVSNLGRVKRERFSMLYKNGVTKSIAPALMSPYVVRGYVHIAFSLKGIGEKNFKLHRLVAMAFIPPEEGKPHVNHIDGNPRNNHLSNLEWTNPLLNNRHRWKLNPNQSPSMIGEMHYRSRLTENDIREIRRLYAAGSLSQSTIGARYNLSQGNVSAIVLRRKWKHVI